MTVGYNVDQGILRLEGHVSAYLPQFMKLLIAVDGGSPLETVLDLNTLTTFTDGPFADDAALETALAQFATGREVDRATG